MAYVLLFELATLRLSFGRLRPIRFPPFGVCKKGWRLGDLSNYEGMGPSDIQIWLGSVWRGEFLSG